MPPGRLTGDEVTTLETWKRGVGVGDLVMDTMMPTIHEVMSCERGGPLLKTSVPDLHLDNLAVSLPAYQRWAARRMRNACWKTKRGLPTLAPFKKYERVRGEKDISVYGKFDGPPAWEVTVALDIRVRRSLTLVRQMIAPPMYPTALTDVLDHRLTEKGQGTQALGSALFKKLHNEAEPSQEFLKKGQCLHCHGDPHHPDQPPAEPGAPPRASEGFLMLASADVPSETCVELRKALGLSQPGLAEPAPVDWSVPLSQSPSELTQTLSAVTGPATLLSMVFSPQSLFVAVKTRKSGVYYRGLPGGRTFYGTAMGLQGIQRDGEEQIRTPAENDLVDVPTRLMMLDYQGAPVVQWEASPAPWERPPLLQPKSLKAMQGLLGSIKEEERRTVFGSFYDAEHREISAPTDVIKVSDLHAALKNEPGQTLCGISPHLLFSDGEGPINLGKAVTQRLNTPQNRLAPWRLFCPFSLAGFYELCLKVIQQDVAACDHSSYAKIIIWNVEPLLSLGLPQSERILFLEVQSLPALVWLDRFWERAMKRKPPTRREVDQAYRECQGFTLASVWEKVSKIRAGELPDLHYRHDLVDTEVGMLFEVAQWAVSVQGAHLEAFRHLTFEAPLLETFRRVARQFFNPITGGVRPHYTRDDTTCSRIHEYRERDGLTLARMRYQSAVSRYVAHNFTATAHAAECVSRYNLMTEVRWRATNDAYWQKAMAGLPQRTPRRERANDDIPLAQLQEEEAREDELRQRANAEAIAALANQQEDASLLFQPPPIRRDVRATASNATRAGTSTPEVAATARELRRIAEGAACTARNDSSTSTSDPMLLRTETLSEETAAAVATIDDLGLEPLDNDSAMIIDQMIAEGDLESISMDAEVAFSGEWQATLEENQTVNDGGDAEMEVDNPLPPQQL